MMPQRRPGPQHSALSTSVDADDVVGDKVIDLARQRRLQAIGDMAGDFLAQTDGLLAQARVEFRGAPNGRFRGLRAADDLDERNQVRRIERMADDAALGVQGGNPIEFRSW